MKFKISPKGQKDINQTMKKENKFICLWDFKGSFVVLVSDIYKLKKFK